MPAGLVLRCLLQTCREVDEGASASLQSMALVPLCTYSLLPIKLTCKSLVSSQTLSKEEELMVVSSQKVFGMGSKHAPNWDQV